MPGFSISNEEILRAELDSTDGPRKSSAIVPAADLSGGDLAPDTNYTSGSTPTALAVGDFNGDGRLDVVSADSGDATVSVFINNGDGTLKPRVAYGTAILNKAVVTGDFTGDGKLDIIAAGDPGSSSIRLLKGNGDGTFQAAANVLNVNVIAIVAADFNGDGKLDLAETNINGVFLELGNGNGTFQAPQAVGSVISPTLMQVADFNGDGKPDLLIGTNEQIIIGGHPSGFAGSTVLLNNGAGSFTSSATLPTSNASQVSGMGIGDVNGDGKLDVVVSNQQEIHTLYLGHGDGTFTVQPGTAIPSDSGDGATAIGDLNNDGKADIAILQHFGGSGVGLFAGNGTGTFAHATYVGPVRPVALTLADMNGDGKLDILTANDTGNNISVLLNSPFQFGSPALATSQFGAGPGGGGWTSQNLYPRIAGDVNGDGRADIVAFGEYGVAISLGQANGTFGAMYSDIRAFGHDPSSGGLTNNDIYPRFLADVNGDGQADIVGAGDAGMYVSLANAGRFGAPILGVAQFGVGAGAGGWSNQTLYARQLGDVNGDGMADIVGFGVYGTYVSLATGGGHFGSVNFELNQFGSDPGAGNYNSNDTYPRYVADVNGDGMADIVGFGEDGVHVALATGGGHFAAPILAIAQFGHGASAGGWSSNSLYPRMVGDVNGDGRADIVGFGEYGIYYALGKADGTFGSITADQQIFGHDPSHGGLTNNDLYPRQLADVNGDGHDDIIATGDNGLFVSTSTHPGDFLFS